MLVVAGLAAWRLSVAGPEPYRATPRAAPAQADGVGAADTLRLLASAWRSDDPVGAREAGVDGTAVTTRLGAATDNIEKARIREVSLRYLDELGGVDSSGTWSAAVEVTWRYGGFDRVVSRTEVRFAFRSVDGAIRVADIGGGEDPTPLWLDGPLTVARDDGLLVLVAGGRSAAPYVEVANQAVPVVRAVVRDWTAGAVVEVPAGTASLERALGSDPGYYQQIAAVTTSADAVNAPGASTHVFVNPDVFDGLGRAGQDVVLAHELVHVATDAPQSAAPTWLVEGFADYVALRDTDLPLSRTAAQIRERVRRDGIPTGLPSPADFDTQAPHLGAVYEASWLLCVTLAARGGEKALVALYEELGDGGSLDRALAEHFDWSEADLLRAWQERLSDLPA